jgi:hypothetical protein
MFRNNLFHIFILTPLLYWISEKEIETHPLLFQALGVLTIGMVIIWGVPKRVKLNIKFIRHIVHILFLAPFLFYVSFFGRENSDIIYLIVKVVSLILLAVHFYEMFNNLHKIRLNY